MGVSTFAELDAHYGHRVGVVRYGRGATVNVALECLDCETVLLDFDADEDEDVYDGPDLDEHLTAGEDSPSPEDVAPAEYWTER